MTPIWTARSSERRPAPSPRTPPLEARSDAELVGLIRSGDTRPLAEIDRRYRPLMLAVARPLVEGTGYEPEDAVQDALLRAARALKEHRGDIALRPWLVVVVRNRALDLRRRRDASIGALPQELAAAATDPLDAVLIREELRSTVERIAALPLRQRTALAARAFEGVSHQELAGRLGSTVPAVKALVMRARHALAAAA